MTVDWLRQRGFEQLALGSTSVYRRQGDITLRYDLLTGSVAINDVALPRIYYTPEALQQLIEVLFDEDGRQGDSQERGTGDGDSPAPRQYDTGRQ